MHFWQAQDIEIGMLRKLVIWDCLGFLGFKRREVTETDDDDDGESRSSIRLISNFKLLLQRNAIETTHWTECLS